LEKFPNLECLTVWAPKNGGTLDFGHLQGDKLRINVLGTPDLPSEIIACKGVPVAAGSGSNAALKASWVRRRDGDTVDKDSVPLGVSTPSSRAEPPMPCLSDPKLRETLTSMVRTAVANSKFGPAPIDPAAVADDILRCAEFGESGDFGFDFTKLDPTAVRILQVLPSDAWKAMQDSAEKAGEGIAWVHLHHNFVLNEGLMAGLKQLSPLIQLSLTEPRRGMLMNLGQLQGERIRLQEIMVRSHPERLQHMALKITAPNDAQVFLHGLGADPELRKSTVQRENADGEKVGHPMSINIAESGSRPTKV
jgi:hypothetical protein